MAPVQGGGRFEKMLGDWIDDPDVEGELVHHRTQRGWHGRFEDLDPPIAGPLAARLATRGVEQLYRHQARAVTAIRAGTHTVLAAGTASGKTLCYQVPIVETILDDPKSTALLLFPTKALAQDQLRSFRDFRIPGVNAATYDGDTPPEKRADLRRYSNIVLTNPDMLHYGILPNHGKWAEFFLRLRYIVIDEMHVLRGMFGSHTAHIIRRLRRLAAHYGSEPTFVFASATIGNPGDLARSLSGLDVDVINGDDSPAGDKTIALWNPPMDDPEFAIRRSALAEATDLFIELVRARLHTIVFTRSRKATELIYGWAADRLEPELADRIAPYRAGYRIDDRRAIEERLFAGDLLGVTATNALELGIDVGSLDAALITTFPGTVASFWQQAGRAGRTKDEALVVLVGGQDALDQYFMNHPDELFSRPPEAAVINPDNPQVLHRHLGAAAYELPLGLEDRELFGQSMEEVVNELVQDGDLRPKDGKLYWSRRERPAPGINLRSSGGPTYTIIDADAGEILGTVEQGRAFRDTHEGAIYLHQGASYLVETLDTQKHEVLVREARVDYYTQPHEEKGMDILEVEARGPIGPVTHWLGRVEVESHILAYKRKNIRTREVMATIDLHLPPTTFETQAFWFTIDDQVLRDAGVEASDVPGTLHAAEHTAIAMMPLFAICDRWDIGGLSTPFHPQTGTNTIFIYDGYPGGAGISPVEFAQGEAHLAATLRALRECPCESGCPSCVQSPKCGNFNEPLSKAGARRLLEVILGR